MASKGAFSIVLNMYTDVIKQLSLQSFVVIDHFITPSTCQNIINYFALKKLKPSQIGNLQNKTRNQEIRSDQTYWLQPEEENQPDIKLLLEQLENLKTLLNREFYFGIKRIESHFAHYPRGSFYKKHQDQLRNSQARRVTFINYLNSPIGGELVIYNPLDKNSILTTISPCEGKLVLFLTDELFHEVLMAQSDRYSITGWFRNDEV